MEAIIILISLSVIALGLAIWLLYKQQQQALCNHSEVLKSFEAIMGAINGLIVRNEQLHSALTSQIDHTSMTLAEGMIKVESEILNSTRKIEGHVTERFNQSNSIFGEGMQKVESEMVNTANKIESLEKSLNEAVVL
jgi:SAM-dependent MidA family methyltransferase